MHTREFIETVMLDFRLILVNSHSKSVGQHLSNSFDCSIRVS